MLVKRVSGVHVIYVYASRIVFATVCIVLMEHLVSKARRHDVAIDWPET